MLIDELAEARVGDPEIEGEAAGAQMLGRHDCDPRGQPARKAKADAAELPEIMVGGEDQRAGLGAHTQRHAETAADMLLEPRRAGEAFGAVDHLRTPARAAIEAGPALTAEIGRAHVRTPVTNAHPVCHLLIEKNNRTK